MKKIKKVEIDSFEVLAVVLDFKTGRGEVRVGFGSRAEYGILMIIIKEVIGWR